MKNPPVNTGDVRDGEFDPWVGKISWRRAWHPLQYSCLGNPMDRRTWQAAVHGVTKSQTRLKRLSTHMGRGSTLAGLGESGARGNGGMGGAGASPPWNTWH